MKKCPPGKYFCTKEKKCMPIPRGHHIGRGGWLEKDEDENGKKNGKSNGNGNGSGSGNGGNGYSSGGNGNGGNGAGNGGVSEEILKIEDYNDSVVFRDIQTFDIIKAGKMKGVSEATVRLPSQQGHIISISLTWRGKYLTLRTFFPQSKKPTRTEVMDQLHKVYPGAKLMGFITTDFEPGEPLLRVV
jgi:hypothetical protein